jgi:hypothetical protein
MKCTQLIRLMKDWYVHVQNETMAPARMMQFADRHIQDCDVCRQDPDLAEEIEKIRDFVLPEAKLPKTERDEEEATPEISPDEEESSEGDEEESFKDEFDDDDEI